MKRLFIGCILALALCLPVRAETYFLTIREGHICYCQTPSGLWVSTGLPAYTVSGVHDHALLEHGMYLPDRAALTRVLEDFCS